MDRLSLVKLISMVCMGLIGIGTLVIIKALSKTSINKGLLNKIYTILVGILCTVVLFNTFVVIFLV